MKTLAIINQKGGVGKSTTAHALGAGLTLKGNKVLYVDLDAQGNLSYTLKANASGYNSLGVLERPETIKEEIQITSEGAILASAAKLASADKNIVETGKEYRLRKALKLIAEEYDYCIIDTPPTLGIVTINALTACDYAIIPAQADIYSLQGIGQVNETIKPVKEYCNSDLKVMGIVLTRFSARSILSRELTEVIEEAAKKLDTKVFNTKIRECISIKEAQVSQKDIYSYAPRSNAAADYKELLEEVMKEM